MTFQTWKQPLLGSPKLVVCRCHGKSRVKHRVPLAVHCLWGSKNSWPIPKNYWLVVSTLTPLKNDGVHQLGWWNSQLNGKSTQIPWFQTTRLQNNTKKRPRFTSRAKNACSPTWSWLRNSTCTKLAQRWDLRQWEGWHPIHEMENQLVMFETTNQTVRSVIKGAILSVALDNSSNGNSLMFHGTKYGKNIRLAPISPELSCHMPRHDLQFRPTKILVQPAAGSFHEFSGQLLRDSYPY